MISEFVERLLRDLADAEERAEYWRSLYFDHMDREHLRPTGDK